MATPLSMGVIRAGLPLMAPQRRLRESTPGAGVAGGGQLGRGDHWPKLRHEGGILFPGSELSQCPSWLLLLSLGTPTSQGTYFSLALGTHN